MKHELISQSGAEEIFHEKEEKVTMLGMKWVSRNRRTRTSHVMPKSLGVKYPERCYEVQTTRVAWTVDEINYGRKFWGRKDEGGEGQQRGRAKEMEEPSGKHEVVKRGDKEKRAASAAPVTGRKPEEATVSPPLKARKFERYVDDVPRGGDGTEIFLKIPEGAVREVLGGCDPGYDLPEGTSNELEMRIEWAKIGSGEVLE